jgi:ribonuclease Z
MEEAMACNSRFTIRKLAIGIISGLAVGLVVLSGGSQQNAVIFFAIPQLAMAEEKELRTISDKEVPKRKNYFPNTEKLGPDEMRVIALGTGTPNFRHSQASASWLVELGNGEKFIFDMGTGSLANLAALEIPYTYLDKIFISHLHVDHIGDLDSMYRGLGFQSNRTTESLGPEWAQARVRYQVCCGAPARNAHLGYSRAKGEYAVSGWTY